MNTPEAEIIYAIRVSPVARVDIADAHQRFVDLSGAALADAWEDGLTNAIASLARSPRRWAVIPEAGAFQQEIRQLLYRRRTGAPTYRVLYTVNEPPEDAPFVRILHVRHAARQSITPTEAAGIEAETL